MIIITGASRGIGKYLFEKYSGQGEKVTGIYHLTNPERTVNEEGNRLDQLDVTDFKEVSAWINNLSKTLDKIILINCAGINYNSIIHKADPDAWERVIKVNVMGTFNMIRSLLPLMREKGFGRIINLSSVVSQMGIPGTSAYAASKAALNGMIKSIAAENAKKGITINNLVLGYYNTGMINEVSEQILKGIVEKISVGKLGDPHNIYKAIEFIREADYLTGACINIDGGI